MYVTYKWVMSNTQTGIRWGTAMSYRPISGRSTKKTAPPKLQATRHEHRNTLKHFNTTRFNTWLQHTATLKLQASRRGWVCLCAVYAHVCTRTHARTQMYTHTHVSTCTHIYAYPCTSTCALSHAHTLFPRTLVHCNSSTFFIFFWGGSLPEWRRGGAGRGVGRRVVGVFVEMALLMYWIVFLSAIAFVPNSKPHMKNRAGWLTCLKGDSLNRIHWNSGPSLTN